MLVTTFMSKLIKHRYIDNYALEKKENAVIINHCKVALRVCDVQIKLH